MSEVEAPLPQSREEDKDEPHDTTMEATEPDGPTSNGKEEEEGAMMSSEQQGGGNLVIRPIFFGNLSHGCMATDVESIFERPVVDLRGGDEGGE